MIKVLFGFRFEISAHARIIQQTASLEYLNNVYSIILAVY